jgi:hypothetical protein
MQDVLHHLQLPLIQAPAAGHAPNNTTSDGVKSGGTSQGNLRFAVRPDGIDGWRPSAQAITTPINERSRANTAAPQPNAPGIQLNAPHNTDDAEIATEETPVVQEPAELAEPEAECDEAGCGADEPLQWSSSNRGVTPIDDMPPTGDASSAVNDRSAERDSRASDLTVQVPDGMSLESAVDDDAYEGMAEEAEESVAEQPSKSAAAESSNETNAQTSDNPKKIEVGPISEKESDSAAVEAETKPTPPPPLTKQLVALRSRVRGVLKGYYRRQLNSREHDPWEVMHGMLAYGVHSRIRQGGPRGEPVTSVGWLCYNKPCKNLTLMYVTPKGELRAKYGVGLQGHLGQLLAMLAQCRVSDEYPIRVGKREFTIKDLIEAEQKTCYPKSELTFKLLAFQYYLDLNDTWVNDQGVEWDFPRLIREELAQPIRGAACGGTHRLSSLSLTVKARQRRGEPLDGEYARAAEFVQKYHRYAFGLQNRDGSLSTEWFRGRGDDSDINRRIKTTGHILEWLCYSLSDEELRQPKTIAAVTYLANLMYSNYDNEWEVGPMSHATHALLLYDERVFQPHDGEEYNALYKPKSRSAKRNVSQGRQR